MSETSLSTLVKEIGEALVLDDNNHDQEAYKKYISCIYRIATNLIVAVQKSGGNVVVDSKTSKQVKLVQQCVERVSSLLEKMDTSKSRSSPLVVQHSSPVVTSKSDNRDIPPSRAGFQFLPTVPRSASPLKKQQQQPQQQSKSVVPSDQSKGHPSRFVNSTPSLVIENNPHAYSANKKYALTPMELARKQNQSLMIAYRARMERLNRSDFSAYNYSLTIQRKMAENIAIAREQEEELARKMQARNLRLEEEAAKRFAAPVGMSKEEQEQRLIYKKILQYEHEAIWLKQWRSKVEASPEDPILISQLVQEILRCSDHPFTELLHKYQLQIYQRLYPLVANKHQEIDIIQVPLPPGAWPSVDDISDSLIDGFQSPVSPNTYKPEQTSVCAVKVDGREEIKQSLVTAEDKTELCIHENKDKPNLSDNKKYEIISADFVLHPLSDRSESKSPIKIPSDDKQLVSSIFSESKVASGDNHGSSSLLHETNNVSASDSQENLPDPEGEDHGHVIFDDSCAHNDVQQLNNKQSDQGTEDLEDKKCENKSAVGESTRTVGDRSGEVPQIKSDAASSRTVDDRSGEVSHIDGNASSSRTGEVPQIKSDASSSRTVGDRSGEVSHIDGNASSSRTVGDRSGEVSHIDGNASSSRTGEVPQIESDAASHITVGDRSGEVPQIESDAGSSRTSDVSQIESDTASSRTVGDRSCEVSHIERDATSSRTVGDRSGDVPQIESDTANNRTASDRSGRVSDTESDTVNNKTGQLSADHGKELESQVSWERRQAQLLMRQVTKDYNSYKLGDSDYDENKLDYLFDSNEEDDEDGYGCFPDNASVQSGYQEIVQQGTTLGQDQGSSLDSYVSDTALEHTDNGSQFESLPSNINQDSKSHEDKQFQKLSQEAYLRHLKSISEDIHRYLEKLLIMMTIAYEPLDNPVGKDQCAVSLEEPFFKPIWKTLLKLFRVVNHKQELMLACVMTRHAGATPADFKVSKKLWLPDPVCKPYQRAVTELACVREHYTMLSKLECVVKVCRQICECVDDYYSKKHGTGESASQKAPSVGADDLLPILSYVVVQSAMPQLCAECHAMTEFIHEGYMMGEEGYCLTSLRTAVNYVISTFPSMARHESLS